MEAALKSAWTLWTPSPVAATVDSDWPAMDWAVTVSSQGRGGEERGGEGREGERVNHGKFSPRIVVKGKISMRFIMMSFWQHSA